MIEERRSLRPEPPQTLLCLPLLSDPRLPSNGRNLSGATAIGSARARMKGGASQQGYSCEPSSATSDGARRPTDTSQVLRTRKPHDLARRSDRAHEACQPVEGRAPGVYRALVVANGHEPTAPTHGTRARRRRGRLRLPPRNPSTCCGSTSHGDPGEVDTQADPQSHRERREQLVPERSARHRGQDDQGAEKPSARAERDRIQRPPQRARLASDLVS